MSDHDLRACPTVFQELVDGTHHIRAHVFGDRVFSVGIRSTDLDWRENLEVPFEAISIDSEIEEKIMEMQRALGLRIGIIDIKIGSDGTPYWLEVNPQGQFLFAEGLAQVNLTEEFVSFIFDEALKAK